MLDTLCLFGVDSSDQVVGLAAKLDQADCHHTWGNVQLQGRQSGAVREPLSNHTALMV